jgi:isoleucyl-tRNA synthetase
MLQEVIRKFEDHIKKETLSLEVAYDLEKEYDEFKINGEELKIAVEKEN